MTSPCHGNSGGWGGEGRGGEGREGEEGRGGENGRTKGEKQEMSLLLRIIKERLYVAREIAMPSLTLVALVPLWKGV